MVVLLVIAALFGLPFIGATGSYISARILFPDMGLGVPGYWKFYWAAFMLTIVYGALALVQEAVKDAR